MNNNGNLNMSEILNIPDMVDIITQELGKQTVDRITCDNVKQTHICNF